MKSMNILFILFCTSSATVHLKATLLPIPIAEETFFQLVRKGDIEKIDQMIIVNPLLIKARSLRERRTSLHAAALGYVMHSNPDCFTVFIELLKAEANPLA